MNQNYCQSCLAGTRGLDKKSCVCKVDPRDATWLLTRARGGLLAVALLRIGEKVKKWLEMSIALKRENRVLSKDINRGLYWHWPVDISVGSAKITTQISCTLPPPTKLTLFTLVLSYRDHAYKCQFECFLFPFKIVLECYLDFFVTHPTSHSVRRLPLMDSRVHTKTQCIGPIVIIDGRERWKGTWTDIQFFFLTHK